MPSKVTTQQADVDSCCFRMSLTCPISGSWQPEASAQPLEEKGARLAPSPTVFWKENCSQKNCQIAVNHYAMTEKMHRSELIICIESMGNQEERTLNPCSDNAPILINSNQVYLYPAKSPGGETSYSHFNPKSCCERAVQK